MNKYLLLAGLCLLALDLSAQEGTWYSINLYPNYSDRRLIVFENLNQTQIDAIDSLEAAKPSYSIGGAIQWRGEFIGFQLGANLVNTGYRTIRQAIPADDPFSGQADEYEQTFTNYLLEVPVELTFYQTLNENNEFFFMMGTGIAYNLTNRTRTTLFSNGGTNPVDNSPTDEVDFRNINVEFQAALGWEKAFSPNLRIVVQPHFQFWLRGLYVDELINRNIYSLGVRLGVKFGRLLE
ncbi:outer membrane beta-barrel protein [Flavilitoribacter nigricans]|nr:outer membrane beta-barrel protein [Flavilitoribacter nigricans]